MAVTITHTVSASESPKYIMTFPKPESEVPEIPLKRGLLAFNKDFRGRDGSKAIIAILKNYLVFAACVAFAEWIPRISPESKSVPTIVYFLSVLIIASRMRALENLVHEASHNNLFPSAALHQRLQFLYAFPVFRLVQDYRQSHIVHHKYLGDPEKDPDIVRLRKLGLDRLSERPIWYLLGVPMTGYMTYEYLTTTFYEFWESSTSRTSKTVFWAAVMLAVQYSATFQLFFYYYVVPFLMILPVTRYWAEASEHLGLDLTEDIGSSRTNIGFLHKWYMNPHNDGYHGVHHLCSQIPFYLLPEAHQHLMNESDEFKTKSVISYGMFETFKQMTTRQTIVKDVISGPAAGRL